MSVEHDLGASDAAPKTLRLFVPYWIKNHSSIPLSYRIVEGEPTESSEADSLTRPDSLVEWLSLQNFPLNILQSLLSEEEQCRRGICMYWKILKTVAQIV